jgi:quercetin dioxygenase-like cupin family protein
LTPKLRTTPPEGPSGAKQSRREVLLMAAATGVALTPGCHGSTPLESRRMPMKETFAMDAPTATPKVVKTKFENDRVRVLEFISDPGDKEDWHFHPAFVVYVVTGGTLRVTTPDGKSIDDEFKDGDIRYREPRTHSTENIGKTRLHAIIVELKTP